MKKQEKLKMFLASGIMAATLLASMSIQPASANETVILPDGANGTNGNPDLLTYACSSIDGNGGFVEVWAPAPVNTNGLSSFDPIQDGQFRWTLSSLEDSSASWSYDWYATSEALTVYSPSYSPGDVVSLTLTATLENSPEVYDESSFDFEVTVVDPSLTEGSGTIVDPYIIYSQDDLEKMRCYENKHFALGANIALSGDWFPIGTSGNSWKGSLDGRGFSITGLVAEFSTMTHVGLFGAADDSYFKDLTIVSPRVKGLGNVGVLAGKARYGVGVENVRIIDAEVTGSNRVGLLMGWKDYGGLVSRTSVQGQISAIPRVSRYSDGAGGVADAPSYIGGMIGFDDGDGTTHLRNDVQVEIDVSPERNYVDEAASLGIEIQEDSQTSRIGGYIGETDEDSSFRFLNVASAIKIVSWATLRRVGGVVGENESPWSELDVDTTIHIVMLDGADATAVGGVFGYSDDQTASSTNLVSDILIESANGSNNSFGIDEDGSEIYVADIGGVGGEYDDDTSDSFIRAKTNISVQRVQYIERVAGYLGKFDDDNGVGYSDIFVSGSIDLNASSQISRVGGFVNLQGSQAGKLTGNRLFAAMTISTSGEAEISDVNPFTGQLDEPDEQLAFNAFWDSTLNDDNNPENHPGEPATTSQLKSRSFLSGLGMDFGTDWDLRSGSYPELKTGLYTWGFSGSTSGGSPGATSTIVVKPAGPTNIVIPQSARQGNKVVVRGEKLNRVTGVFVGGKRVNYTLRTNGTLTFKAPKLAPKKYQVRLVSETAETVFKKKMRITSR